MKHAPKLRHPNGNDFMTKHHVYPQGRIKQGNLKTAYPSLTIRLWDTKHKLWHKVFRCMTIDEIIWHLQFRPKRVAGFEQIFKCKAYMASNILKRFKRIKTRELMNQETALRVAHEVSNAIKDLDHLYVVIVVKENGERDVKVKLNKPHYGN